MLFKLITLFKHESFIFVFHIFKNPVYQNYGSSKILLIVGFSATEHLEQNFHTRTDINLKFVLNPSLDFQFVIYSVNNRYCSDQEIGLAQAILII